MPDDRFGFLDVGVPKALTPPAGYESVHVAGMSWAIQGASLETTSWLSPAQWNHIIAQFRGLLTIASIDLSDVPDTSPLLLRETLVRAIEAAILANSSVIDIADAIAALRGDAPSALDTLEKLAASIGDDDDFAGTMTAALAALSASSLSTGDIGVLVQSFDQYLSSLIPVVDGNADITIGASHRARTIQRLAPDTTIRTYAIPANATDPLPIGFTGMIDNDGTSGNVLVTCGDTLSLVGIGRLTGTRTIAVGGHATYRKVAATRWRISGSGIT